jgi:hypothetical protein
VSPERLLRLRGQYPGLDHLQLTEQLGRHHDLGHCKALTDGGIVQAGAAHRTIARADISPLGLHPQERGKSRFVFGPETIFLVILVEPFQDQAKAAGVILCLVTGPQRRVAKRAARPGAPGPFQFPRRALTIAAV